MAWTAKWSSITFSLMAPPPKAVEPPKLGRRAPNDTSFFPGWARVGGAV